ncbi:MAG TPA: hypothetical protein DER70_00005, partial [Lentisphaeria bacterium]|nr:hypothetical protein [Lentisphaeria bacterium]
FRAMHDQLIQLDRSRCRAPAPEILILQFAGHRQKESVLSETSIFNRILRKKTLFFMKQGLTICIVSHIIK